MHSPNIFIVTVCFRNDYETLYKTVCEVNKNFVASQQGVCTLHISNSVTKNSHQVYNIYYKLCALKSALYTIF